MHINCSLYLVLLKRNPMNWERKEKNIPLIFEIRIGRAILNLKGRPMYVYDISNRIFKLKIYLVTSDALVKSLNKYDTV